MIQLPKRRQLVRRYVGKLLSHYYAQPANKVVGHTSSNISGGEYNNNNNNNNDNLSRLSLGEWHWRRVFKKLYDEREGHWLTPVELFQPHYSNILGNYCIDYYDYYYYYNNNKNNKIIKQKQQQNDDDDDINNIEKFDIVELGGGRGTNAKLILNYIKQTKPTLYDKLTYTIVDSSPSLHKLQKQVLSDEHKVQFVLKDLIDVAEEKVDLFHKSDTPTVVIGCELLDNLPHDKVIAKTRKNIQQAEIDLTNKKKMNESFAKLSDPLLSRILRKVPSYVTTNSHNCPTWIPTVACGILQHLIEQRSNLSFVFADFDWLPPPDIIINDDATNNTENNNKYHNHHRISEWAEGEPIVTDMDGIDHECYLCAPKYCDILFPTDFDKLALFVKKSVVNADDDDFDVCVEKQSEFLERYGPEHIKATKSWLTGHTPLLHDFTNCSVLTGRILRSSATATGGDKDKNNNNNKSRKHSKRRSPPKIRKPTAGSDDTCIMFYSTKSACTRSR